MPTNEEKRPIERAEIRLEFKTPGGATANFTIPFLTPVPSNLQECETLGEELATITTAVEKIIFSKGFSAKKWEGSGSRGGGVSMKPFIVRDSKYGYFRIYTPYMKDDAEKREWQTALDVIEKTTESKRIWTIINKDSQQSFFDPTTRQQTWGEPDLPVDILAKTHYAFPYDKFALIIDTEAHNYFNKHGYEIFEWDGSEPFPNGYGIEVPRQSHDEEMIERWYKFVARRGNPMHRAKLREQMAILKSAKGENYSDKDAQEHINSYLDTLNDDIPF